MPKYKVRLVVHIYNKGGLHPFLQDMKAMALEAAEQVGQITPEQAGAAKQQLALESRPVCEQCSFSKTLTLPFTPIPSIEIEDNGFMIKPTRVSWDPDKDRFDVHMDKMTCGDCDLTDCSCIKHLMAEENEWEMFMTSPA